MPLPLAQMRCRNQRLTAPGFTSALEVVEWLGAIQAQDYGAALWAIGKRARHLTADEVTRAISRKEIVRTWSMRRTIHFVPAKDVRWMLDLTGARENDRVRAFLRTQGHGQTTLDHSRQILKAALGNGPLTRPEIQAKFEAAGIATADSVGINLLAFWAQAGMICFASHHGKQPTFALLDDWIGPAEPEAPDRTFALATLALRYFNSHGPATERDFAWWSGLTLTEAREAIALVRDQLAEHVVAGAAFLTHAESALNDDHDAEGLHLLPSFDEILVGYKDRSAYDYGSGAHDARLTLFNPTILFNGRLVGVWKKTPGSKSAKVAYEFVHGAEAAGKALLDAEIDRLGQFWGMPVAT